MSTPRTTTLWSRLAENPIAKVVAYYILLFAASALFIDLVPGGADLIYGGLQTSTAEISAGIQDALTQGQTPIFESRPGLPFTEVFAMAAAFLLMLPVTWIYVMTRRRKGFRQSVVQTLVILPIVVAGVVFMVKNSLALAFSLGGIVAAVSFRNTLRDTKDAVYIFLAIAVGLAAGVQVMSAAAVMSFIFNIVILIFWYTDFGRAPAHLEGPRAARRLERSMALANRTGAFVAQLDRDILKSMSPEQLQALLQRAQRRVGGDGGDKPPKQPKPLDTVVRVQTPDPEATRPHIEAVLASQVKAWRFSRTERDTAGTAVLEYRVRLRKSVSGPALTGELRSRLGPRATGVETR